MNNPSAGHPLGNRYAVVVAARRIAGQVLAAEPNGIRLWVFHRQFHLVKIRRARLNRTERANAPLAPTRNCKIVLRPCRQRHEGAELAAVVIGRQRGVPLWLGVNSVDGFEDALVAQKQNVN